MSGTHRYVFRKFPYSAIYFVDEDVVVIVAIAHDKRPSRTIGAVVCRNATLLNQNVQRTPSLAQVGGVLRIAFL